MEIKTDNIIGAKYQVVERNAKELSEHLKSTYKKNGVDYNQFNSDKESKGWKDDEDDVAKNPPIEIYEYQNFILLEKLNGELCLLDGFRRLLWYNAPSTNISVRIYKQSDLSNSQIFNLMMYLNHFKFYGQGNYYDRGFALLLNSIFGLSIFKYHHAFDAYLSSNKTKSDYGGDYGNSGAVKNITIKERILNPMFVSDIKFLEALNDAGCMIDRHMGALTYMERQKDGNNEYSAEKFLSIANSNKVLEALMVKYKKVGTDRSAKSQDIVNQIIEIYQNIFKSMRGGKVEKSYAEKTDECKAISKEIQKDKNWTKLTGAQDIRFVEDIMERIIRKQGGDNLAFKCVIYPKGGDKELINCGLHTTVKFKEFVKARSYGAKDEMNIVFPFGKDELSIHHNYGGYWGYGKKYTTIEGHIKESKLHDRIHYEIDLFVNVPKSEVDKAKGAWKAEGKKNSDAYYAKQSESKK